MSATSNKSAAPADASPITLKDDRRGLSQSPVIRQPYLFVLLEADRLLAGGARYALSGVHEVLILRGDTRGIARGSGADRGQLVLTLPGRWLSGTHARLLKVEGGWVVRDEGSTNGTYVNGARVTQAFLGQDGADSDIVEVGHNFLAIRSFFEPATSTPTDLDSAQSVARSAGFATLIPTVANALADLQRVAATPISVVLTGATGTGKEILARGVHELSGRTGPFVAVNCGALTKGLVESQLFGHIKGAFSGAIADTPGFVRAAEGGTLLLDEIGDLDRAVQAMLLRVLQEREVVPVGSARAIKVDVRLVSASPKPLADLVAADTLRSDLQSRLQSFWYALPLLKERRPDFGLLVAALLAKHGVTPKQQPRCTPELALSMLRYDWPRNVRELEQFLLHGWALENDGLIDLPPLAATTEAMPAEKPQSPAAALSPEDETIRERLLQALKEAQGNVAEVARQMGKARMQVQRWCKRFAIDPSSFR